MNRVSQLFTKKFIATALLSFNGIDTYFQTFRYFFPSIPFDSQQNDPALLRRKFFNMEMHKSYPRLADILQQGNLEYYHESDYCVYIIRYYYNRHDKDNW